MRWLDCSAYTGELAASFVEAAISNGVEGLCVQLYGGTPSGTGLNPYRFQHLDLARSRGLRLGGYSWPAVYSAYALAQTPGYAFDLMGLDVEAGAGMTRADVDAVKARGVRPVKYASPHTWSTIMGNTNAFADVDTWLAYYLQQGWQDWGQVSSRRLSDNSRTMMVQVQGTTTLLDDQFDLNVADRAWFPAQEDDMAFTPEDINTLNLLVSNQLEGIRIALAWANDDRRIVMRSPENRAIIRAEATAAAAGENAKVPASVRTALLPDLVALRAAIAEDVANTPPGSGSGVTLAAGLRQLADLLEGK